MTSPDGVNWTVETTPGNGAWSSVAYGSGLFVAASYSGQVMTSPDGVNWTLQTVQRIKDFMLLGMATVFLLDSWRQSKHYISGWHQLDSAFECLTGATWNSVAYGEGYFVAISTGSLIATSPDGINWVSQNAPASDNWSVVYNNGFFVAVANSAVMTLRGLGGVQFEVYGSGNNDIADFASSSGQSALYIAANGNVNIGAALSLREQPPLWIDYFQISPTLSFAVDANGNVLATSTSQFS